MKKFFILLFLIVLIFALYSCSFNEKTVYYTDTYDLATRLLNEISYDHSIYQISTDNVEEELEYLNFDTAIMFLGDVQYVDRFAVLKLNEEGNMEELETAISNYFSKLNEKYEPYKESEVTKINETSVISIKGDYLVFVISKDNETATNIIEDSFISKVIKKKDTFDFEEELGINTVDTDFDNILKDYYPKIASNSDDLESYSAVLRIGDTAYEYITYDENSSKNYALCVSEVADTLSGISNVYNIVIPTSGGITLPDEYFDDFDSCNQKETLYNISTFMSDNVNFVNIYENLMLHRDEYLYFRTDHHWTMLGAYYAYEVLMKEMDKIYFGLNNRTIDDYGDYLGLFYHTSCNYNRNLGNNPDTLYVVRPHSEASLVITDFDGSTFSWPLIQSKGYYDTYMKYISFIGGDYPFDEITSENVTDGSTLVVIKDSFGNAFVPLMVDHYENIYVIDLRYWSGNISDFAISVGADDVLFINNMSMIRNTYLVGKLADICMK